MRKYFITSVLLIVFALSITDLAVAGLVSFMDFSAVDTVTTSVEGNVWRDNRLRAYDSDGTDIYGYMKFDISSLSNDAVINSLILTTYAEGTAWADPVVDINHVAYDTWSRSSVAGHIGGADALLSAGNTGFDSLPQGQAYQWTLDATAHDWSSDITDNYISLSMTQTAPGYRAVYWYGSGSAVDGSYPLDLNGVYAPTLRIGYEISEDSGNDDGAPVPEPATLFIFGSGILGLFLRRKV